MKILMLLTFKMEKGDIQPKRGNQEASRRMRGRPREIGSPAVSKLTPSFRTLGSITVG